MVTLEKGGVLALVGRPNAGKSTLLNKLAHEKKVIVSNKPQTTRNNFFLFKNINNCQVVIIDTPGLIKARDKFGAVLTKISEDAIQRANLILLVSSCCEDIGRDDHQIISHLRSLGRPVILGLSKIDLVKPHVLLTKIAAWKKLYSFHAIVPFSCFSNQNITTLKQVLSDAIPAGTADWKKYNASFNPPRTFHICEVIREKILRLTYAELPHQVGVKVIEKENTAKQINIYALVFVNTQNQKKILIGKEGVMLKKILALARQDLKIVLGKKVVLFLKIKVIINWRTKGSNL